MPGPTATATLDAPVEDIDVAVDVATAADDTAADPQAKSTPKPQPLPRLAITVGEPAGIGPELVVRLAQREFPAQLIAIGDGTQLADVAESLGVPLELVRFAPDETREAHRPGRLFVVDVPLFERATPGQLSSNNASQVLAMLSEASDGALAKRYDAIVTGPVHKGIVAESGTKFTGHTEFFAERAERDVVMMLVAPGLRVALATTHLPLVEVSGALRTDRLTRDLRIIEHALRTQFGLRAPHIAVLGLNPHAGEGGHLGREEIETIEPVCAALRTEGMQVDGPISADTAFVPSRRQRYDAYLAMFHDQGLPVLKALGFGEAVNVTLGLPYVRTSVDHGVALDLAGRGIADVASFVAATELAIELVGRSR